MLGMKLEKKSNKKKIKVNPDKPANPVTINIGFG
jgi:hypothetical protein